MDEGATELSRGRMLLRSVFGGYAISDDLNFMESILGGPLALRVNSN